MAEKEISLPYWSDIMLELQFYVKSYPIESWDINTAVLYGSEYDLCESDIISNFINKLDCDLTVMQGAGHIFYTVEQLGCLRRWLKETIFM